MNSTLKIKLQILHQPIMPALPAGIFNLRLHMAVRNNNIHMKYKKKCVLMYTLILPNSVIYVRCFMKPATIFA
jgi:hypothetical protein